MQLKIEHEAHEAEPCFGSVVSVPGTLPVLIKIVSIKSISE